MSREMNQFDLLIKNGTIYTAAETFDADIAVKDEKITAIGQNLGNAEKIIDAEGLIVLPGGICLLYTSPSPRDRTRSRMPSSA